MIRRGERALQVVARLIRPMLVAGLLAVPIATADTPNVVPLGCEINWTRTGGVWIYTPDCSRQSPPSPPSPNGPPPGIPAEPPPGPPTAH